jgi:Cys-tRNA(Pro)/Cys-tRNA(Cys) deacylase
MNDLHKLHENVQAAITGIQCDYKVHDHSEISPEIRSPQDFAAALGYPIQRITKTLFLCSQDRMIYAAAVCSIDRQLNFKSTANAIGVNHIEISSVGDLLTRTGYPKNGVSPLGLAEDIAVVVDTLLFEYPTVLIGGGAIAIEIEISPSDLMLAPRVTMESITT